MEKYVRLGFVLAGLLTWVATSPLVASGMMLISPNLDRGLIGARFSISDAVGLLCGVAVTLVLWFNRKVNQLGMEIAGELRNVTWPSWAETRVSTIVVIVTTLVVSLILGVFDAVASAVTGIIYSL